MASYEYAADVSGEEIKAADGHAPMSSEEAIRLVREALYGKPEGTTGGVWRWRSSRSGVRMGHGKRHRAYVVNARGIVERTDR